MNKICTKCSVDKPITEYPKSKGSNGKQYYYSFCKSCKYKKVKEWFDNNKGYQTEWKKNNPEAIKKAKKQTYEYMKTIYIYGGVYKIIADGEVVYVGRSRRINDRMSKHRYYHKNPDKCNVKKQRLMYEDMNIKYTDIQVEVIELTENHVEREKFYIDMYKPIYNNI